MNLIDGFTFLYNVSSLSYPYIESILSTLPIVDLFHIVVVESQDNSLNIIRNNFENNKQVKIYEVKYKNLKRSELFRYFTNLALSKCKSKYCFYIQGDEVFEDTNIDYIINALLFYEKKNIDGFLLKYRHFYGSVKYYHSGHGWYEREIRIIKNNLNISSWGDAQGFRKNKKKLNCILLNSYINHYGWVLPPEIMWLKNKRSMLLNNDIDKIPEIPEEISAENIYTDTEGLEIFDRKHPNVLKDWIENISWSYKPKIKKLSFKRIAQKNIADFWEKLFNKRLFEYQNYILKSRYY